MIPVILDGARIPITKGLISGVQISKRWTVCFLGRYISLTATPNSPAGDTGESACDLNWGQYTVCCLLGRVWRLNVPDTGKGKLLSPIWTQAPFSHGLRCSESWDNRKPGMNLPGFEHSPEKQCRPESGRQSSRPVPSLTRGGAVESSAGLSEPEFLL